MKWGKKGFKHVDRAVEATQRKWLEIQKVVRLQDISEVEKQLKIELDNLEITRQKFLKQCNTSH